MNAKIDCHISNSCAHYIQRITATKKNLIIMKLICVATNLAKRSVSFAAPKFVFQMPEGKAKNQSKWYRIDNSVYDALALEKALPLGYLKQVDTFSECQFILRSQLLDLVNCMSCMNPTAPVVRYVLFGKFGTGKTTTLCQALHWAYMNDFIICHVPFARKWIHNFKEVSISTWKSGRIDMPLDAAAWLEVFKRRNEARITALGMKTSKDYVWGARDSTKCDEPLMSVVELGIARPKFATDCVGVLLKELKLNATNEKCKLFVSVDCVNSFFTLSRVKRADKTFAEASCLSLVHAFKKMLKNDWNNGIVVVTVDSRQYLYLERPSYLPLFLLGREGFELLEPFVPIHIEKYTEAEARSYIEYMIAKNWIQHEKARREEGQLELMHLSDFNPLLLDKLCAFIHALVDVLLGTFRLLHFDGLILQIVFFHATEQTFSGHQRFAFSVKAFQIQFDHEKFFDRFDRFQAGIVFKQIIANADLTSRSQRREYSSRQLVNHVRFRFQLADHQTFVMQLTADVHTAQDVHFQRCTKLLYTSGRRDPRFTGNHP
ncbi:28S ribosomal protein S29, mitochondrial [Trichinella patagoniensis]|uniref:Small ribosomal subunit protein mS29 n=1 Tax=Trichinella patagoniensis TaxID=990121 RepID=A0A0V1A0P1_9BILA|nr:28S ribosomal protein S29, mitochondrial [Trichinella patagoniensis]